MQKRFFLAAVLLVTGCGGGAVHISNYQEDGALKPATAVVELLEKSQDAELPSHLQNLNTKLGDGLNWAQFWNLLSQSQVRSRLVPQYEESLLSVQYRTCRAEAFEAYAGFILAVKSGYDYVLGAKRVCETPLKATTFMALLRSQLKKQGNPVSGEPGEMALRRLTSQIEQDPGALWQDLLGAEDHLWLRNALNANLNSSDPTLALNFARAYLRTSDELIASDLFAQKLFQNTEFVDALMIAEGASVTARLLAEVAAQHMNGAATLSDEALAKLQTQLLDKGLSRTVSLDDSWNYYLSTRKLLSRLYRGKDTREILRTHESLQLRYELQLSTYPIAEVRNLLEGKLDAAASSTGILELSWFAYRFAGNNLGLKALAVEKTTALAAGLTDPAEEILAKRLAVHFSPNEKSKREKAAVFCSAMEDLEIAPLTLTLAATEAQLKAASPVAGCFDVESDGTTELSIVSTTKLFGSVNSYYRIRTPLLKFQAPELALGMVDLSMELKHEVAESLPTPESSDALTLPLLVGISLPATKQYLARGTHFFIIHLPIKESQKGPKDTRASLKGFSGGSIELAAGTEAGAFSLITVGGPGQEPAPAAAGGRSDSSSADAAVLTQFVSDYEANGATSFLESPYSFHSQLSAGMAEDLIQYGKRNDQNQLEIFIAPDFSSNLPDTQEAKFQNYCANGSGMLLTPLQITACAKQKLIGPAFTHLNGQLTAMKAQSGFRYHDMILATSLLAPFTLPAGAPGDRASVGPMGDSGSIRF
jgi:hypothetical protein